MRAPGAAAELQVRLAALGQPGADLLGGARRARCVLDRAAALQPQLLGRGGKRGRELGGGVGAGGRQRLGGLGEGRVPDPELLRVAIAGL